MDANQRTTEWLFGLIALLAFTLLVQAYNLKGVESVLLKASHLPKIARLDTHTQSLLSSFLLQDDSFLNALSIVRRCFWACILSSIFCAAVTITKFRLIGTVLLVGVLGSTFLLCLFGG